MPTKRQKEKAERNAQRFIRLVLRGWRVETIEELPEAAALLRKAREARTSPFPRRTYPTDSVTGMPSAV